MKDTMKLRSFLFLLLFSLVGISLLHSMEKGKKSKFLSKLKLSKKKEKLTKENVQKQLNDLIKRFEELTCDPDKHVGKDTVALVKERIQGFEARLLNKDLDKDDFLELIDHITKVKGTLERQTIPIKLYLAKIAALQADANTNSTPQEIPDSENDLPNYQADAGPDTGNMQENVQRIKSPKMQRFSSGVFSGETSPEVSVPPAVDFTIPAYNDQDNNNLPEQMPDQQSTDPLNCLSTHDQQPHSEEAFNTDFMELENFLAARNALTEESVRKQLVEVIELKKQVKLDFFAEKIFSDKLEGFQELLTQELNQEALHDLRDQISMTKLQLEQAESLNRLNDTVDDQAT